MASGYLCYWCGENPPGDDWRRHTDLRHRVQQRDRERCWTVGVLLVDASIVLLVCSMGLRTHWPQAWLLRLAGLACLADAGLLWLSCWGLARYQAWQMERARWTAALHERTAATPELVLAASARAPQTPMAPENATL